MRSPLKTAGLLLPLVFVQAGIPAFAANPPPNVSSQVQIAEKRMQETAEKGLVTPKRKPVIEKEKEPEKAPEEIPELRFPVTRIEVDGNQAVSSEELRGLVAPYENKEQSMRELTELAQRIEEYYAQKGFITSVAYIPAQKSADGVFRIQVVEGKTGEILVEGNRYSRTRRIRSYIRIPRGKILRYRDIEKSINKLNQNADREVQAVLKKGEKPETTDIVFKVRDRFPLHAGFLNDNQGSEPSGKQRVGFFLRDSNVTGFDDALFTGTIFGKHFGSVFTQYLFPVATTGTRLSAGFSHSQVDPQKYLKAYGVNGTSQNYYGMIDQRLISAGRFTLDFAAKMEFKESRTKVLSGTNYRERLRLLRAGPYAHLEDRWGLPTQTSNCREGSTAWGPRSTRIRRAAGKGSVQVL
ncbi:MAG: POTRA domain-containing protein [Candidatus Omnitrophota bacterium]